MVLLNNHRQDYGFLVILTDIYQVKSPIGYVAWKKLLEQFEIYDKGSSLEVLEMSTTH